MISTALIKKSSAVAAVLLALPLVSEAAYVVSTDPAPDFSGQPSARVRNGNTGFEAILFTPADPSPGSAATQLNPPGAPIWNTMGNTYGVTFFTFEVGYIASTGTTSLGVDFNRDGDYLDTEEFTSSTSPTLAGMGFNYVNLFYQGNGTVGVTMNDFTLNGTNFGTFATTSATAENQLFERSGGSFDITATGSFTFTGNGGGERPRFMIQFGDPVSVAAVPEPETYALMIAGLAAIGFASRGRKSKA